jgi:hypothetical protein
LEYSAVSIPANPGAIVGRDLAEMAIKCLGEGAITKGADGTTFLVNTFSEPTRGPVEKLEASLEQLITLARIVKGQPLDKAKLSLVGTATALLNEIITEHDEVSPEEIGKLHNVIKELASVVGAINPDSEAIVKRTIANVSKALYQK